MAVVGNLRRMEKGGMTLGTTRRVQKGGLAVGNTKVEKGDMAV